MKPKILIATLLLPIFLMAQNDSFDKVLKVGEILVNGFTILKSDRSQDTGSTIVESLCVNNKLNEKVTFKLAGEGEEKELIIPINGKECLYKVNKGVWEYLVTFPNGEVYKKGQHKLEESEIIVLRE